MGNGGGDGDGNGFSHWLVQCTRDINGIEWRNSYGENFWIEARFKTKAKVE